MRLHKALANAGIGSRRSIENWIRQGRIQINGTNATIGQMVLSKDKILVDGKAVQLLETASEEARVLIYNKPEGEICSKVTEKGKKSVFESLPFLSVGRWVMVGRLDVNTSGLLLFTNNGELAHQLMHPRFNINREYAVRVIGKVTQATLARLKKGVKLESGVCQFKDIQPRNTKQGANQWFTVTLSEGKYREVRELFASQNCTVSRLIRIKYGQIALPVNLKKGQFQELPLGSVRSLLDF